MNNIKYIVDEKLKFDIKLKEIKIKPYSKKITDIYININKKNKNLRNIVMLKKLAEKVIIKGKKIQKLYIYIKIIKEIIFKYKKNIEKMRKIIILSLLEIPNIPQNEVPNGINEKKNRIIYRYGTPNIINLRVKSHKDIEKEKQNIDFVKASKISGSKFVILKNKIAKLERNLIYFMLELHITKFGLKEISLPVIILEKSMTKTGHLPKFKNESFKISKKYRLIPTSEVSLICMHFEETLLKKELPIRYVCGSNCFRLEIGKSGKEKSGLIRQHQFFKVELVSIVEINKSNTEIKRLKYEAEYILKKLRIPYRVSLLCKGEISFCSNKTYDIEVWMPYINKFIEVSSCSNCGNFQTLRMKTKYKEKKKLRNPHTLNCSGLAIGRTIASIIENYQGKKNGIIIRKKKCEKFFF